VHRDLKPDNVLLSGGHAVVADFGIAKALAAATEDGASPDARLTGTGVAIGTPAYMAPEQALGDPAMDHRADLYALGVIAYEMLAGRHPFAGRTAQALAAAHLTETPTELAERRPDAPPGLAALVMRLLAKDPAARPQRADDVRRALDEIGATPSGSRRWAQRRTLGTAALVLAVVAGIVAYALRPRPRASATGPAAIRTLAVLPFANVGGTPNDEYFSDGLTDELAHALARVPGLQLPGRTSTYALKGTTLPAREIGRTLDVSAYIDGAVRRAGERLRVSTQLVSATDGKVLWDSVFETRTGDVFAVQDSLTRAVVAALAPTLGVSGVRGETSAHAALVKVKRGTTDAEAYELYLKGMYYWHERGAANVARSIGYFQQAIARDPTFARAYAALAFAYNVLEVYVPDPADSTTPLIEANARRAMTLDSTLADAQLAMASALERNVRFADAEKGYRAALRIEPLNQTAHHALGFMLMFVGRTDEAIDELRQATRLDPLAKSAGTALAEALINARRFREAEVESRRILAIDSTFPLGLYSLGGAQAFGGQPDSAVRTLERGVRLYPQLFFLEGRLLYAYAAAGRWDVLERMRAQLHAPGGDRTGGVLSAVADLVLGDREPIVRLITTPTDRRLLFAMLRRTAAGTGCNPLVDPLWADARYRAAMRDLGVAPCPQARPWPITPRVTR
jgi:serine/threonine-protein kinase